MVYPALRPRAPLVARTCRMLTASIRSRPTTRTAYRTSPLLVNSANTRSRSSSLIAFESFKPSISSPRGRKQAAATTGPASGPRPASSVPTTVWPFSASFASIARMPPAATPAGAATRGLAGLLRDSARVAFSSAPWRAAASRVDLRGGRSAGAISTGAQSGNGDPCAHLSSRSNAPPSGYPQPMKGGGDTTIGSNVVAWNASWRQGDDSDVLITTLQPVSLHAGLAHGRRSAARMAAAASLTLHVTGRAARARLPAQPRRHPQPEGVEERLPAEHHLPASGSRRIQGPNQHISPVARRAYTSSVPSSGPRPRRNRWDRPPSPRSSSPSTARGPPGRTRHSPMFSLDAAQYKTGGPGVRGHRAAEIAALGGPDSCSLRLCDRPPSHALHCLVTRSLASTSTLSKSRRGPSCLPSP